LAVNLTSAEATRYKIRTGKNGLIKRRRKMNEQMSNLTLLLMYLTGWEEDSRKNPGEKIFRAWKGYMFQIVNKLSDEKLIIQIPNAKSIILTESGIEKAKALKEKLYKNLEEI
jgi:hypothetical protein